MWSRNGKQIVSVPHIFESLKPLFESNPDLIFDGELFALKESCDFNKIISCVKKTKPTEEDLIESKKYIQYWVYDLPSNSGSFISRYKELLSLNLPNTCVVVSVDQVDNMNDVDAYYEDYVNAGFEGQMLRVLDSPYQNKRSSYLLKHKSFFDAEFIIKGVKEGIGNLSNKVGTLQFEIDGKIFSSAVNGTHDYLEELWKNKDTLIGQTATIKYFELTSDGIPRFPKIIQIGRESYE
jgi:DNA ligase-1